MKDPVEFVRELEHDPSVGRTVTKEDLDEDAASFMAFAQAFGIKPPSPGEGAISA